jgi:biotin operon repressor
MFLVAVTKDKPQIKKEGCNVYNFIKYGFNITVVTDNFLSTCRSDDKNFEVLESVYANNTQAISQESIILKVSLNNNILTATKEVLSGRPLYYHINKNKEVFISTHISMLREAGVKIDENKKVLPEFFVYRFIMPPLTMFKETLSPLSALTKI